MLQKQKSGICCCIVLFLMSAPLFAEEKASDSSAENSSASSSVTCSSAAGEQQHCPADTASGVILMRSTGSAGCLLGKTWGYDDKGVWVKDGCIGDFLVSSADANAAVQELMPDRSTEKTETWGFLDPGQGFLVGKSKDGELSISAYALLRYLNQTPAGQTFIDHNGTEQTVDARNDIYSHRVLVFFKGWLADPKLVYNIALWTVNTTDQDAIFANIGYQFHRSFNLYGGINGNPGSRSLQGSHPYWLGNDRVMADEFFRPFFTQGIWANGEVLPGLWYSAMIGNTSSTLGVTASKLDREFTTGISMWWMPTTHEFGPRGGYGDWENHQKLATRFGFSFVDSPEQRFSEPGTDPGNTTLKLADSLNLFSVDALAPGVTVTKANYQILAFDAGLKYRGIFLQTEFYSRLLDSFEANGSVPVNEIVDQGFYIQAAFFPVPKKIELYTATSQIYGDDDAGFGDSSEYLVGMNYYPMNSRNYRVNAQIIDVNKSPVSSTFGYYTGGQTGTTFALAASIFF
jgi:hypothetical protein